ncbi:MAG TPA: DUF1631 family protein, partial [Nevskiaceae bacterium]|nr:DUF1631 family protein [Nevskiaceae bacterium]
MTPIQSVLEWGRTSMTAIVQRMLDSADDTLFGMAESSHSHDDRRNLFDSMRMLRVSSGKLIKGFEAALYDRAQDPLATANLDQLELVDDDALEEDIVVSRITARIEDAAKQSLWEYAARLENLKGADDVRAGLERLRPAHLSKAFRQCLEPIAVDGPTKLVVFKLYERQLMSDSSTVYEGLNLRLEAAGVTSKNVNRRVPPARLPAGQHERRQDGFVPSQLNAVAPVYQIPTSISSLLYGGSPAGVAEAGAGYGAAAPAGYGSGAFDPSAPAFASSGTAYGSAGGGAPGHGPAIFGTPGLAQAAAQGLDLNAPGSLQRISLVAQLMLEASRGWSGAESDAANGLLVPLIRIALGDPGFFTDAQHPARVLLASLVTAKGGPGARLDDVRATLDAMAAGSPVPQQMQPLSATDLHRFLVSQRSAGASTSARMEEAKAHAYQQIRALGSGRDLPVGMAAFLTQVWLPLVSSIHLKFGAESDEMRRATRILQRLFAECRWLPQMKDTGAVRQIVDELEEGLGELAVPPPLVTKAKTTLQDGLGVQEPTPRLLDVETLAERAPPEAALAGEPANDGAAAAAVHDDAA